MTDRNIFQTSFAHAHSAKKWTNLYNTLATRITVVCVSDILIMATNPPLYSSGARHPLTCFLLHSHINFSTWISVLIPMLSNDVELNPGNYMNNGFLSVCNGISTRYLKIISNVSLFSRPTIRYMIMILFLCVKQV